MLKIFLKQLNSYDKKNILKNENLRNYISYLENTTQKKEFDQKYIFELFNQYNLIRKEGNTEYLTTTISARKSRLVFQESVVKKLNLK